MARNAKLAPGIQVFRGSRPRQDVFSKNSMVGCCGDAGSVDFDKLAERTRFDNALAHSNPLGGIDRYVLPYGDGFADTRNAIINGINDEGVGFKISVLAVPTYAFVTGVGIHIESEEPGLTFDLVTRNGLVLPQAKAWIVEAEATSACEVQRTVTVLDPASTPDPGVPATIYQGFGALGSAANIELFGRDPMGEFSLEADEIALRVASMPANGIVTGDFNIRISVAYQMLHRAEF